MITVVLTKQLIVWSPKVCFIMKVGNAKYDNKIKNDCKLYEK